MTPLPADGGTRPRLPIVAFEIETLGGSGRWTALLHVLDGVEPPSWIDRYRSWVWRFEVVRPGGRGTWRGIGDLIAETRTPIRCFWREYGIRSLTLRGIGPLRQTRKARAR